MGHHQTERCKSRKGQKGRNSETPKIGIRNIRHICSEWCFMINKANENTMFIQTVTILWVSRTESWLHFLIPYCPNIVHIQCVTTYVTICPTLNNIYDKTYNNIYKLILPHEEKYSQAYLQHYAAYYYLLHFWASGLSLSNNKMVWKFAGSQAAYQRSPEEMHLMHNSC